MLYPGLITIHLGCLGVLGMLIDRVHHQIYVIHGGIVVFVLKSIRIGKMRLRHSQLLRSGVHHLHKFVHRTADCSCNGHGGVIGGIDYQEVKKLIQRHRVPRLQIGDLRVLFQVKVRLCHRDGLGQVAILQTQKRSHDFGNAGGVNFPVNLIRVQGFLLIQVKKESLLIVMRQFQLVCVDIGIGNHQIRAKRFRLHQGKGIQILRAVFAGQIIG